MFFKKSKVESFYYRNAEENAFFYKTTCDICGKKKKCCNEGVFENGVKVVCADCFAHGLATAEVPPAVANRLRDCPDVAEKVERLRHTPPIGWMEENKWPVCCQDFMTYEGFWGFRVQEVLNVEDNLENFRKIAQEDPFHLISNIEEVYRNLSSIYSAHIFTCPYCGMHTVILEKEQDEELLKFNEEYQDEMEKDIQAQEQAKASMLVKEELLPLFSRFKKLHYGLTSISLLCALLNFFVFFPEEQVLPAVIAAALSVFIVLVCFILTLKYPDFYSACEMPENLDAERKKRHKRAPMAFASIYSLGACLPLLFCCSNYPLQLLAIPLYAILIVLVFGMSLSATIVCFRKFSWEYREHRLGFVSICFFLCMGSISLSILVLMLLPMSPLYFFL